MIYFRSEEESLLGKNISEIFPVNIGDLFLAQFRRKYFGEFRLSIFSGKS
jgi:hypothetical protein